MAGGIFFFTAVAEKLLISRFMAHQKKSEQIQTVGAAMYKLASYLTALYLNSGFFIIFSISHIQLMFVSHILQTSLHTSAHTWTTPPFLEAFISTPFCTKGAQILLTALVLPWAVHTHFWISFSSWYILLWHGIINIYYLNLAKHFWSSHGLSQIKTSPI